MTLLSQGLGLHERRTCFVGIADLEKTDASIDKHSCSKCYMTRVGKNGECLIQSGQGYSNVPLALVDQGQVYQQVGNCRIGG